MPGRGRGGRTALAGFSLLEKRAYKNNTMHGGSSLRGGKKLRRESYRKKQEEDTLFGLKTGER